MMRDEEQIRDFLKDSLEPIHAHDSIYTKVMFRMQSTKRRSWNLLFIFKRVVPLTLVLVMTMGIFFPVFGKEGTLIDIYNSYRVHRNLNTINTSSTTQGENAYRDSSIGSYYLSSLLEKDYNIEPGSLLQIKAQNPDDRETVALIVLSKLSGKTPEEILLLRKRNMSWGRILAYYKINPREAIFHFATLQQKIVDSLERRFVVRGTIDTINEQNGIFYITGIPFPIQITLDTIKPQALTAGSIVAVNVVDFGDSQNVQALQIAVLQQENIGFIVLRGEVLERDQNTITLQLLRNQKKIRIQLSPRIMELPSQIFLRSGTLVHVEVSLKKNMDGLYVAYRWGKIVPLPRIQGKKKK
jgi:hypothetical protein